MKKMMLAFVPGLDLRASWKGLEGLAWVAMGYFGGF
jgi:hypothetical protein